MPEEGFTAVTLPRDLVQRVKDLIETQPELGFTSVAEFVKTAIRLRLERYEHAPDSLAQDKEAPPWAKALEREVEAFAERLEAAYRGVPHSIVSPADQEDPAPARRRHKRPPRNVD